MFCSNYPNAHQKVLGDAEGLSPYVPTVEQTQELENYAKSCGLTKIVTIYKQTYRKVAKIFRLFTEKQVE